MSDLKIKEKIKAVWYFKHPAEKAFLLLSILSLFYSLVRIANQGVW